MLRGVWPTVGTEEVSAAAPAPALRASRPRERAEQRGTRRAEPADETSVGCSFGKWDLVRKMNAATSG